jgi:hypothetical protein
MSDPFTQYRLWAETNTLDERVRDELLYAITWMEHHAEFIDPAIIRDNAHPCTAFSLAIKSLINQAQQQQGSFQPIIDWLADNQRCPFGLMLKTKAYKALRRSHQLLTRNMLEQLSAMQQMSLTLPYRPREFEYLDKLLSDPQFHSHQRQEPRL